MLKDKNVLILGIGNFLWADEGFDVRAVEEMNRIYETPENVTSENVTLMDGGTKGIYLVQHLRDADVLIIFDAVDYNLPRLPVGTIKRVEGDIKASMPPQPVMMMVSNIQEAANNYAHLQAHLIVAGNLQSYLENYVYDCSFEPFLQIKSLAELEEWMGLVQTFPAEYLRILTDKKWQGPGTVETARGRLVHLARVENDVIKEYKILAPTEWNFHPEGVVSKALVGLNAEEARVVVEAIDPCVDFELRAA